MLVQTDSYILKNKIYLSQYMVQYANNNILQGVIFIYMNPRKDKLLTVLRECYASCKILLVLKNYVLNYILRVLIASLNFMWYLYAICLSSEL